MESDGRFSFAKLLNIARMSSSPMQPIKALTYLSPYVDGKSSRRAKISIVNNASMEKAFRYHHPTTRQLIVHPVEQANTLHLSAAAAAFTLGDCIHAEDPPRIRLCAADAVVCWDLSSLVPGRYAVSAKYYRGTGSGSVYIHVGILHEYPSNPTGEKVAVECREAFPDAVFLNSTGNDPYDTGHYREEKLGEFEMGEEAQSEYFVIAAEVAKPLMSVRGLDLTYLGI